MKTLLPIDENSNPIPALRLRDMGAHQIAISDTANRNVTAFDAQTTIISIYTTSPIYLKFGDGSVTATSSDHYFPAGVYYDVSIGDDLSGRYTHVSAIQVDSAGVLYISEKY